MARVTAAATSSSKSSRIVSMIVESLGRVGSGMLSLDGRDVADPQPCPRLTGSMAATASLTLIVLLVAGCGGTARSTPPRGDASIKAAMVANISEWRSSAWYGTLHFDGAQPDIGVTDGVLIVATLLDPTDTATANSVCRSIAAITNSGDTGLPLGVKGVVIISGSTKVADCKP